ncbi:MAG: hypothetical protein ACLQPH_06090, partial [Acidimicrobiales bacterium]
PLEAVLTNDGAGQATYFGWREPYPDCPELAPRLADAERITDKLCERDVERTPAPSEREAFAAAVTAAAAVLG